MENARRCLPFRRLPLGELAFGLTASAFRHAPLRSCPRRVGLRAHDFRFSARTASEIALGGLVLPLGGLVFGLTTSAFRHAPIRSGRWAGWPSGSLLPLFGMRRFGVATGRVRSSAFRFGDCPRRVGLRAHCFRFSARTASGLPSSGWFFCLPLRRLPLGGLAFGLTASAFRHAPLRGCPRRVGSTAFRFGDCRSAGWPSGSPLPLFGAHRFGVAARRVGSSAFRFGDCHSAGWCFRSAGWPSGSRLPLFGMHRFGVAARRVGASARRVGSSAFRFGDCRSVGWASGSRFGVALGELAFGLTASAFRHAPLRSCPRRVGASAFRFGVAARRVGLRAHCFRFSARIDPHRRTAEARTDGAQRHDTCFTSKHLSQHVNLPHRTP